MSALGDIAARAKERKLPFLLAGGHAVIAHGFHRATFDLDLIIPRRDRDGWLELAGSLGYRFAHEGLTFLQFEPPKSDAQGLDLMMANDNTFDKLLAESVPSPPSEPDARMVSLLHLLALKCHAIKFGHKGRLVKDADDVIRLVQANRLDVNDEVIRDVFLKYGTADLYEKVRRIGSDDETRTS